MESEGAGEGLRAGDDNVLDSTIFSLPILPLDVYGVIAEFLAGAYAFMSLSNLNVVNHLVHAETLPVLYETLFLDRPEDITRLERMLGATPFSKHNRYVKFIIGRFFEPRGYQSGVSTCVALPRLTMMLCGSHMHVFRPVTTSTALAVLARTPTYAELEFTYRPDFPHIPSSVPLPDLAGTRCIDVMFFRGAGRFVTDTAIDPKANIDIDTSIESDALSIDMKEASIETKFRMETILEVLKIDGLKIARWHKQVEDGWNKQSRDGVALFFSREEVQAFVSSLPDAMAVCPEIMLNRLMIKVASGTTTQDTISLLAQIQAIYQDHVTTLNFLQLRPSRPYIMVEIKGEEETAGAHPPILSYATAGRTPRDCAGRLALYDDGTTFTFQVEVNHTGTRFNRPRRPDRILGLYDDGTPFTVPWDSDDESTDEGDGDDWRWEPVPHRRARNNG